MLQRTWAFELCSCRWCCALLFGRSSLWSPFPAFDQLRRGRGTWVLQKLPCLYRRNPSGGCNKNWIILCSKTKILYIYPGVATKMWHPLAIFSLWLRDAVPPYAMHTLTHEERANFRASSKIWITNSRVGATMRHCGRPICMESFSVMMLCKIGKMKAAVLPLPVWAQPVIQRMLSWIKKIKLN